MKLIEGMKKLKSLAIKADDLTKKVSVHCADLSFETPLYEDQKQQVREWIQAHSDICKEILRLRVALQRTNLATPVTIDIDGKNITKSIAEWIHRRRDLAKLEMDIWGKLGDRGLREGVAKTSQGVEVQAKIRRYFDPQERDHKIELYRNEPMLIDSTLETVNAVTDLMEQDLFEQKEAA